MESAEELVITKLDELQRQLAEKETKRKRAESAAERRAEAADKKREEEEAKAYAEYERIRGEYEEAVRKGDKKEAKRLERGLESVVLPALAQKEAPRVSAAQARRDREIDELQIQVQLLKEIKEMIEKQHGETKKEFGAIEKRDGRSSQQSFWLTVGSSTASLVAGWLLSLAGSPTAILHLFTH